jgi:hypothetical protein
LEKTFNEQFKACRFADLPGTADDVNEILVKMNFVEKTWMPANDRIVEFGEVPILPKGGLVNPPGIMNGKSFYAHFDQPIGQFINILANSLAILFKFIRFVKTSINKNPPDQQFIIR